MSGGAELDNAFNRLHRHELVPSAAENHRPRPLGVFCSVDGVDDLLGGEADIDRMQHRYDHRHGKKTTVMVAVPIQHRQGTLGLQPLVLQGIGQAMNSLPRCTIAVAKFVGVDERQTRFDDFCIHHRYGPFSI